MNFTDKQLLIIFGVVVVGGVVAYDQASRAAGSLVGYVNPASPSNIFYAGVNAVGASISGSESWSLGEWLYDISH